LIARGQGMPNVIITRETWPILIETVRKITGQETPIWQCVSVYYNVCAMSLSSVMTKFLWNVYCSIGGTSNENLMSYNALPAVYVDACNIIEFEKKRIDDERNKKRALDVN